MQAQDMNEKMKTTQHHFSIIELIIVIATISTILSLLIPSLKKIHLSSQRVEAINNLKTVYQAQILYTEDYQGRIVPLRAQNFGYDPLPTDWRNNLHQHYLGKTGTSFLDNPVFGNETHLEFHRNIETKVTFTMNTRVGYRPNPYNFQGPTTMSEVLYPSETFFMGDGLLVNAIWFTAQIWPGQMPYIQNELFGDGRRLFTYFDGKVDILEYYEIPYDPSMQTVEHLMFWRGRKTVLR